MGQTTNHAFPYPELTDPADVPADIKALADALDDAIPVVPVIPPGGGGFINIPVLDVGMAGQNRAGRQLTPADFTQLGLSAPLGLWNLSNVNDSSGNNRTLVNKGAVPFGLGIGGQPATAAVFAGSTGQALYTDDVGVNDPLRIATGSVGCWARTAKRGVAQHLVTKWDAGGNGFNLQINSSNVVQFFCTPGYVVVAVAGVSDAADDRWHFLVATCDGTALRLFIDGTLEATFAAGPMSHAGVPFNIGAATANAATAGTNPHYGRVDEAFVTADVLTEDQIRCLYCAKLQHALGAIPGDVRVAVHRLRKGAALTVTDFPTSPLRLYNFTAGDLAGAGSDTSGNRQLTNNGAAVPVGGVDGTPASAFSFAGAQNLSATDAGLPAGTAARSFGVWLKTTQAGSTAYTMLGWGTQTSGDTKIQIFNGQPIAYNGADQIVGPFLADGTWHLLLVTEDNAAGDGVRRKMYLDGRLVGGSTVLNGITLAGTNACRIGAQPNGTSPFIGQIDGVFVCGYALTQPDVLALYAKGSQDSAASTKNAGDHIERVDGNSMLATFDTLQTQFTVDLGVAA